MWEESAEAPKPLRKGLTTGTCATACATACAWYLLSNQKDLIPTEHTVSVTLPKGKIVELNVTLEKASDSSASENSAVVSTIKDAGDDPDVTHNATVFVELTLIASPGVSFKAGEGVGTVTREGLLLPVGEPAINPVPRKMMIDNLNHVSKKTHYQGGFAISVGIKNGEQIAQKTMNPRLGIVGGLSVLGTTGIVRPFSCAAWIASIYQGIDVAIANGVTHIAASTGNSSEQAIKQKYQLEDMALIEMGDFAGAVLKHLKKHPVKKLSVCGGFGKITKLANGDMDLNSRVSPIDFEHIARVAEIAGANSALKEKILGANTSIEALKFCNEANVDLAKAMCGTAWQFAKTILPEQVELEILAINRQGEFVASANSVYSGH